MSIDAKSMTADEEQSGAIMAETTDRLTSSQRAAELLTVDVRRDCEHGHLRRQCETCEHVSRIAELERENASLQSLVLCLDGWGVSALASLRHFAAGPCMCDHHKEEPCERCCAAGVAENYPMGPIAELIEAANESEVNRIAETEGLRHENAELRQQLEARADLHAALVNLRAKAEPVIERDYVGNFKLMLGQVAMPNSRLLELHDAYRAVIAAEAKAEAVDKVKANG